MTLGPIESQESGLHFLHTYDKAQIRRYGELLTLVENVQTCGWLFEPLYVSPDHPLQLTKITHV